MLSVRSITFPLLSCFSFSFQGPLVTEPSFHSFLAAGFYFLACPTDRPTLQIGALQPTQPKLPRRWLRNQSSAELQKVATVYQTYLLVCSNCKDLKTAQACVRDTPKKLSAVLELEIFTAIELLAALDIVTGKMCLGDDGSVRADASLPWFHFLPRLLHFTLRELFHCRSQNTWEYQEPQ